ncbi:MAG: hypothetical protein ABIK91_05450 [Pseudomonadota bacterium]|nr:hypothetical protein [Pseudomonadota bacterium]MBU3932965.1 hypothetical protein [Pseudomonadota bacterium]
MAEKFNPVKAKADELLASKSEEKAFTYDERDRTVNFFIKLAGAGISLFIIATLLRFPLPAMMQRAAVLMLSLFVIFLLYPMFRKKKALDFLNYSKRPK